MAEGNGDVSSELEIRMGDERFGQDANRCLGAILSQRSHRAALQPPAEKRDRAIKPALAIL
jgi:hypothetical protein